MCRADWGVATLAFWNAPSYRVSGKQGLSDRISFFLYKVDQRGQQRETPSLRKKKSLVGMVVLTCGLSSSGA